jgi:Mg-chelatase subunit ChlD
VVDASSSMAGAKIDAARAAASAFARAVQLPADQVAVVGFNATGWLAQGLTGDRAAIERALAGLAVVQGTRIDLGLSVALDELAGPRRKLLNRPVIILLTDGIQQGDLQAPLALADRARALGIELHAIGLGADVDAAYLEQLAGDPARYHAAPGPEQLADIYRALAEAVPCRAEPTVPFAAGRGAPPGGTR